jgi:hypothetical protein
MTKTIMLLWAAPTLLAASSGASSSSTRRPARAAPDWEDNFEYGLDEHKWGIELTQSGGGNGEFEMYVNSHDTAFVEDGVLHLRPVLTEKIMEELHGFGETTRIAREELWLSEPHQPISNNADFFYAESMENKFHGRRLVLPFKHVRYTTNSTNVCFDNVSSAASQPGCENMWMHRYNAMDMSTQTWPNGRFQTSKCTGFPGFTSACQHTAGDWFSIDCDDPTDCPPEKTHYTMLQPVASAKLSTRMHLDPRFGRVEIRAQLPRGDWLWPAIWMLPTHNHVYGRGWPMCGEIDIVESRGNTPGSCDGPGGYNAFGSALHWGPSPELSQYERTMTAGRFSDNQTSLVGHFHTFGLKWDEEGLFTYIDDEANKILEVKRADLQGSFWEYAQRDTEDCVKKELGGGGGAPECTEQKTTPAADFSGHKNLWENGTAMAPFDTPFYLMLNVAVGSAQGSAGGYFPAEGCGAIDGGEKPWKYGDYPEEKFMGAAHQWLPTWVAPDEIGWAVHCALGSATETCMPANSTLPVKHLDEAGASGKLKDWYEAKAAACTRHTTRAHCEDAAAECEFHALPCPMTANHAALKVDSVKYWGPPGRTREEL